MRGRETRVIDMETKYPGKQSPFASDRSDDDRRLRVLIVGPSLDIRGGQAVQAARLLEGLSKDPELEVSFLPVNPRLPGPLRLLQAVKYLRTIVTSIAYVATLFTRVRKYNLIHIFSASYISFLLAPTPAILIARLFGKKIVLNYRSGEAEDHLLNWRTAIPIIRLADMIVVPSGYLVSVFARFGLKARSIFNLVDLDCFRYRERRPIRPVFLTSRLLEPLYNVPCVLRAFAIIQQSYPEATLTVAGDGWLRPRLERLACELNLRNTKFLGFVPLSEMPDLYDSADIYLSGTNIDNMPASITESMAAGLNVVTTDGGGAIPFIMTNEESGLIVPRDDSTAMAAAAIRLIENPELAAALARNAREASRGYTWQAVQREWLQVYRELSYTTDSTEQARAAGGEPLASEMD